MSPRPYALKGQPRRADAEYLARLRQLRDARKADRVARGLDPAKRKRVSKRELKRLRQLNQEVNNGP